MAAIRVELGVMGRRPPDDYDAFFRSCLPKVLSLARRLTGSHADAEDVAVEALARAFANWARVGSLPYREAWVLRVATNLVIGQSRRRPISTMPPRPGEDPSDGAALRLTLLEALRRLSRRQREAVVLRYVVGLGADHAAQAMGVGEVTVRTHANRGLANLRTSLGPELGELGVHHDTV